MVDWFRNMGLHQVLGAFINKVIDRRSARTRQGSLFLSAADFNHEVARERIRATRRSIPFCLITIELTGNSHRRRRARMLARLLERNVRVTDHKGLIGPSKFAVLLVDTPEMGGRSALERLTQLTEQHNLKATLQLRVHDPEGFEPDDDSSSDGDSFSSESNRSRRRSSDSGAPQSADTYRVEGADVQVSSEDPLVERPIAKMSLKRAVDIVGGSVGLVLTSPFIVGGMLAIKLTDKGPVMYKQTREGFMGQPFTIYKLRTMVVNADQVQHELRDQNHRDGPAFKMDKDPRVTRVGNLLRKTCIDELPQLWNVIRGEMSLVGPRPLPWHESRACQPWHRRRLDVRPGLTCYWQVNKSRAKTFDDWMRLDLRYIDEHGFFKDLTLIAQTIVVPLMGRGGE